MKTPEMAKIKTLIVEDEESSRIALRGMLEHYFTNIQVVGEAFNLQTAIDAISQFKPQLLLLDIRLEDCTAFDLLGKIDLVDFKVIILTAYPEFDYAQQAIRYGVSDYLLKPFRIDDLHRAIDKIGLDRATADIETAQRSILAPTASGQAVIPIETIVLLEADGPYTTLFLTTGEKYVVSKNLKQFETQLPNPPFFRSHDSAIVNFDHVQRIAREGLTGRVELTGEKSAPISARRLADFKERFREYRE